MFQSARIKLTTWYLFIIVLISMFFSVIIYQMSTRDIERIIHRVEARQKNPAATFYPPPPMGANIQELRETEDHLLFSLVFINLIIIGLAGGAGYFLAGKTLEPIQDMVNDQNRFITDASHELRTPLTALRSEMEASLLEKNIPGKDAKALIASNLEEVISLQFLSDRLLELTHHNNNRSASFSDVSLAQAVDEALKKVKPLARKKTITISNKITDATIRGDEQKLRELFIILLDNAIKYSPEKTTIFLNAKKKNNVVDITVRDEGIGIDAKDLPHVFNRFFRGDKSRTKSAVSGYGLGLAIAKQTVERHGGTIHALSKTKNGTTFIMQLPVKK